MKNVLFYKSNTGYTKEYVDMLQNRIVPLEVYKVNKVSKKLLKDADNIFFGGPIRNNIILGLDKFLDKYKYMEGKNIYIFAVGIQPADDDKRDQIITCNCLDAYHVRLFLILGGLDLKRMNVIGRTFMKLSLKLAAKKDPSLSSVVDERINGSLNFVSNSNLDRMVEIYHKVNLKK